MGSGSAVAPPEAASVQTEVADTTIPRAAAMQPAEPATTISSPAWPTGDDDVTADAGMEDATAEVEVIAADVEVAAAQANP